MSKLKTYRKKAGLSQLAFAELIGTTQATVCRFEGSDPKISLDTAMKIERVTNGKVQVESWPQFAALKARSRASVRRASDA